MEGDLVYWKYIQELVEELQLEHTAGQWRLFTDSLKVSLTAVLLPLSHWLMQFKRKELLKTFRFCCKKSHYEEHQWNICADLKSYGNADSAARWMN
jgi:hypothetical protein